MPGVLGTVIETGAAPRSDSRRGFFCARGFGREQVRPMELNPSAFVLVREFLMRIGE